MVSKLVSCTINTKKQAMDMYQHLLLATVRPALLLLPPHPTTVVIAAIIYHDGHSLG